MRQHVHLAIRGPWRRVVVDFDNNNFMVFHHDIYKRHGVYASSIVLVIIMATRPLALTLSLIALLIAVRWHSAAPVPFLLISSVVPSLASGLCVRLSTDTFWFAHGLDSIGVPLWLFPLHGLLALWVCDAYRLVTLRDLRKSTLPQP